MPEWGQGLTHKRWTEVSSSVPHLLQMGLLPSPTMHKCLLKVLCPVSRPITTFVWVLLKDNSRAPVVRSGPEINSRACLCVLQVPRHNAIQLSSYILPIHPQERLRPNEPLSRATPCEFVGDFIPSHSSMPRWWGITLFTSTSYLSRGFKVAATKLLLSYCQNECKWQLQKTGCFKKLRCGRKPSQILSQSVHRKATCRCDDTRDSIIQFLPSWRWAHVLETCRGLKWTYYKI